MNYGSDLQNKSSSLNQWRDKVVADELSDNHRDFQKMGLHNYVNKEITLVRSNDIMMYAWGKHTQLNIGWKVHPKYGLK